MLEQERGRLLDLTTSWITPSTSSRYSSYMASAPLVAAKVYAQETGTPFTKEYAWMKVITAAEMGKSTQGAANGSENEADDESSDSELDEDYVPEGGAPSSAQAILDDLIHNEVEEIGAEVDAEKESALVSALTPPDREFQIGKMVSSLSLVYQVNVVL